MERNRPRGREKNITGGGKGVHRRGQGLGTGPVGEGSDGFGGRPSGGRPSGGGQTRSGRGSSPLTILLLLLLVLGGGGGGLGALLGGQGGTQSTAPIQESGTVLSSFAGNGSVSTGWQSGANVGRLDTSVAPGARTKRTEILGGGKDTVTIMVYMCGTDLESKSGMATADLQEMLNADIGKNVNLLVYTGGCTQWRNDVVSSQVNQIYQVESGGLRRLVKDGGSVSMTDPDTLSGFIRWCAENFPANRNELILWDHGGGSITGYGYDQ